MNEQSLVHTSIVMLLFSILFYIIRSLNPAKALFKELGWGSMLLSMLSLIAALFVRSQAAEYFALSNMYESMIVMLISVQTGFLVLDRRFNLVAMSWPVALVVLVALVWDLSLSSEIKPLQAALQSYWRAIHVPVIISSYGMFTLAFISSVVYLVQNTFGSPQPAQALANGPQNQITQNESPDLAIANAPQTMTQQAGLTRGLVQADVAAAQSRPFNLYDEITYRCVALGFPLLTVGIILGGLWANEAWGNYWSWDPKESMSLVTLLGYGVYLHLRVNGEHSAKTLSWVSVIGFALMLLTYFGVNIMGVGLHSYGKIG
jgi:cytochrome c-type biogenesis protein CcsB